MSDRKLRELEQQRAQNPGDETIVARWIMARARAGDGFMVKTLYKIKYKEKYFSKSSYSNPWTKTGTSFSSKAEAVRELDSLLNRKTDRRSAYDYRGPKAAAVQNSDISKIKLVEIVIYSVENDVGVDWVEEKTRIELSQIAKQKAELAKQEAALLEQTKKRRTELLKKEQRLLRKQEKSK